MRHEMSVKPDPVRVRKFLTAARQVKRRFEIDAPPLIYLTDPARNNDPSKTIVNLPAGSAVIYRHFGAENRIDYAWKLRTITTLKKCRLLIANDPELAMSVNADGVHWPERFAGNAKYWRQRFSFMTGSAHSRTALHTISMRYVDAALLSTVFPSSSPSASEPIGALKFRTIAHSAPLATYALGGVLAENVLTIADAGGIAAISGIEEAFGA